jgi:two-component system LytT family sensor kinase
MKSKTSLQVLIHIFIWAGCLSIPVLIFNNALSGQPDPSKNEYFGLPEIVSYLCFISFFYFNAYYLLPNLFFKKKIIPFLFLVILIIITIGTTNALLSQIYSPQIPPRPFIKLFINRSFTAIANLALSTSYRLILENFKRERELKEMEKEKIMSELSFLRSQISPHFIFNILNSIVSLVRKKSDQAEPVLIELSSLMRYMLYESDAEKVSIKTVETYMTSYINLQKMRFGDDVKIDFIIVHNSEKDIFVEPMLFIPLVENAFKHGIGIIENPEIKVLFSINQNDLKIEVSNNYNLETVNPKDTKSGIGLNNLRRRLDLLYPEKHKLELYQKNNKFVANLKIEIP